MDVNGAIAVVTGSICDVGDREQVASVHATRAAVPWMPPAPRAFRWGVRRYYTRMLKPIIRTRDFRIHDAGERECPPTITPRI